MKPLPHVPVGVVVVRAAFVGSLMMIAAAFAGCLETESKPGTTAAPDAASVSSRPAGDNASADLANTPPVAVIQVGQDGTDLLADNGSFFVAAGVNVTFDGSNSTDAQGDALTFAWDFGDGNTSSNATTQYAFTAPGNKTILLTVTDAAGASSTANVTLVVAPGGPAPGTWLREDVQNFGNAPGGTYVAAGCFATLSKSWVFVDVEANGTASAVKSVTVTMAAMTSTGANGYTKLSFKGPDGKVIKEALTGAGAKKLEIPGPLPAGTYKVEAAVCSTYVSASTNSPAVAGVAVYVSV